MKDRLGLSLLFLRLGVFIVMFFWTIDKFVRPDHAVSVFEGFYFLSGLSPMIVQILGVLELVLLLGFLIGFKKRLTYGAVFVLHGISTVSSFKQYFAPFEGGNLMFFAAWPMLAACLALYLLRDDDKLLTVSK